MLLLNSISQHLDILFIYENTLLFCDHHHIYLFYMCVWKYFEQKKIWVFKLLSFSQMLLALKYILNKHSQILADVEDRVYLRKIVFFC